MKGNKDNCRKCKQTVKGESICCNVWNSWYHSKCTNLTKKEFGLTSTLLLSNYQPNWSHFILILSDHSSSHLFPPDHFPSHSFHSLKPITFRFIIIGYTHITLSLSHITCHSTFQPISSLEINNKLGVFLDKYQLYKIILYLELNSCALLYSLPMLVNET